MEMGEEGDYIPIATLSPLSCIKMGIDESHFNVSFIVRDKVTRAVSTNHNLFEEKGEPKRNRAEVLLLASLYNALPLGQTGSQNQKTELCWLLMDGGAWRNVIAQDRNRWDACP